MSGANTESRVIDLAAVRDLAQSGREIALPAKTRRLVEKLCATIDRLASEVERLRRADASS